MNKVYSKVSIVIPVYNESLEIARVIESVLAAPLPAGLERELIVVDDGSNDGTSEVLRAFRHPLVRVHHSMLNFGKGTAIRVGLKYATGDIVMIQDGDMEYKPSEIQTVLAPILKNEADVVYGSRFLGSIQDMKWKYRLCNRLLAATVSLLYGCRITDEATAYKAFDREVLETLSLQCRRFEFCPEVTAKVLRQGRIIHEVPITYLGRTVEQGKKIRLWDAVEAFATLLRFRFWNAAAQTKPARALVPQQTCPLL